MPKQPRSFLENCLRKETSLKKNPNNFMMRRPICFWQTAISRVPAHNVVLKGHLVINVNHAERSEEHTSELQSRGHLVCRLLLEKKKTVSSAARGGQRFL